jgi:hypothetical protein
MSLSEAFSEKVTVLRNDLTLWAIGRHALSLEEVQAKIVELDRLLQQITALEGSK